MTTMFRNLLSLCILVAIICPVNAQGLEDAVKLDSQFMDLMGQGRFVEAVPLAEKSLALREAHLPPDSVELAGSLRNVALAYLSIGKFEAGLSPCRRAAAIFEKALGPEDPQTAGALHYLATLHYSLGDHRSAIPIFRRTLAIYEKTLGKKHPNTATSLDTLGQVYASIGDYEKAERAYKRALDIREEVLGPEDPNTANNLVSLGLLYQTLGNYRAALPLYQRSLATYKKLLGPSHPFTANNLNNLGGLYKEMGKFSEALPYFQEALEIRERILGPEHPDTAQSLNNLALAHQGLENYETAQRLHKRSLAILQKIHPEDNSTVARSLGNQALVYQSMGKFEEALILYRESLSMLERTLGPEHSATGLVCNNLATLCVDMGKADEALAFAKRGAKADFETTKNVFSFASENQRLAFQNTHAPYNHLATLGSAPRLLESALQYKGLVLDTMIEDLRLAEASEDLAAQQAVARLKVLKHQLNTLTSGQREGLSNTQQEARKTQISILEAEVEELQIQLARFVIGMGSPRRAFSVTPEQVRRSLPKNSVLVEFLRYDHYLGSKRWELRYGAVLLPATEGDAIWVPLGSAEELDGLIRLYQQLVRSRAVSGEQLQKYRASRVMAETPSEISESLLSALYQRLWAPIESELPRGTKTVILSPDGQINFVSFATLVAPDKRFLAEKYLLTNVSSGRDLLENPKLSKENQIVLLGDPTFETEVVLQKGDTQASLSTKTRDWNGVHFAPLPYTRVECEALDELLAGQGTVQIYLAGEATEARLRSVSSPRILHLATHGFFLPKGQEQEDPMGRSGLALTGAQSTVDSRLKGLRPDPASDGILTAAEVGLLPLQGTSLVTLSACDTASGESRPGEGVLGLRRGFIQAGTSNLLMTLWPVADLETSQLMQDFYQRAEDVPSPVALAQIQREWLIRLRDEERLPLNEVVRLAGPFLLTFQGPLKSE